MSTNTTPWYAIRRKTAMAQAAAGSTETAAEILIYGDIGESWYEETVTAKQFIVDLNALDVDKITTRINSQGGSVPDGLAIYNAMKRHRAHITTSVEGMALSIASLIAMGGDVVEIADNAMLMIHAPWTYAAGNSKGLRETADMLDKWAEAMATSYAAKTGRDAAEMLALLTDGEDHYYTAAEAVAAGFADVTSGSVPPAAMAMGGANRFKALASAKTHTNASHAAPAATPQLETTVPQALNTNPAGSTTTATPDASAIRAEALRQDQARRDGISAAFQPFAGQDGVSAVMAACQSDFNCTVEAANTKLLAHLAKAGAPLAGSYVVTVEDERDKQVKATANALFARCGLEKADTANPMRGDTLYDMARASLLRAGFKVGGMDKMAVVAAAFTHSTSDFTNLLANVATKAMLKGVEEAEETFRLWTAKGTLSDFKPAKRVGMNSFGSLPSIKEGGEYTFGTIGDRGQSIALAKYGKRFAITREAIINDDLDGFTKVPRVMGRAAIRTVGDLVYAVLTSNPLMDEDGKALFHADHANLAGAGGVISTSNVDAMRVMMARQKLPGQGSGSSNIRLANLLVPVTLEGLANTVRDSEYEVGNSTKNNTTPNTVRGTFEVISDARLDDASVTAWYGAASSATNDTIEVAYLDGNDTPTLEQQNGWSVDGVEFKVRMEAGVAPLDFRSMVKNPGA